MAFRQKRILLLPPDMSNLGGTELETLIFAKTLLNNRLCQQIEIFTEKDINEVIRQFVIDENIIFSKMPSLLNNKFFLIFDRIYNRLVLKRIHHKSFLRIIYWQMKSYLKDYHKIIIIGANNQFFYLNPINIFNPKKVIVRYTYVYEQFNYTSDMLSLLGSFSLILTTSEAQKCFVVSKTKLTNIKSCDVFIHNESLLLNLAPKKLNIVRFGVLARISREKNIEDAIQLIYALKSKGKSVSLNVNGPCYDTEYFHKLLNLIQELNLVQNIKITPAVIPVENIPDFFINTDIFLITSKVEGGPNTGLESIAAGVPCLSYDVGAMKERLKHLSSQLICRDFNDLVTKSISIIHLDNYNYQKISQNLKYIYINNYLNKVKLETFLSINNFN